MHYLCVTYGLLDSTRQKQHPARLLAPLVVLRRLVPPKEMARWSLTSLPERLVKIGVRLIPHARCLALQIEEVVVTRDLFEQILSRIRLLSPVPT